LFGRSLHKYVITDLSRADLVTYGTWQSALYHYMLRCSCHCRTGCHLLLTGSALQLTTLQTVHSRWPGCVKLVLLASPFLLLQSYNITKVSHFVLLEEMFHSSAFVPLFYCSLFLTQNRANQERSCYLEHYLTL